MMQRLKHQVLQPSTWRPHSAPWCSEPAIPLRSRPQESCSDLPSNLRRASSVVHVSDRALFQSRLHTPQKGSLAHLHVWQGGHFLNMSTGTATHLAPVFQDLRCIDYCPQIMVRRSCRRHSELWTQLLISLKKVVCGPEKWYHTSF